MTRGNFGTRAPATAAGAGATSFKINVAAVIDGGAGDDIIRGSDLGNDRLYGSTGSDWLIGGTGTDRLYGGAGGDILDGGADQLDANGNNIAGTGDILEGGGGSDQYVFGRGDGSATIFDDANPTAVAGTLVNGASDSLAARIAGISNLTISRNWAGNGDYTVDGNVKGGEDAIVFRAGITMNDLVIERSGGTLNPGRDLIIALVTKANGITTRSTDQLIIKDWFEGTRRIEWLRFANGDDIRIGDISSYLIGTGGNDVIIGTNGADFLYGGDGNTDEYSFANDNAVSVKLLRRAA